MFLLILFATRILTLFIYNLHSTMFLLIQSLPSGIRSVNHNLHSTMFLLIPRPEIHSSTESFHLHSTMFLLILRASRCSRFRNAFTFHYVSTYTNVKSVTPYTDRKFTFHYVSTYTSEEKIKRVGHEHLHSTMFLLIPAPVNTASNGVLGFTFHYVSTYTWLIYRQNMQQR